jgi:hypothetical protein
MELMDISRKEIIKQWEGSWVWKNTRTFPLFPSEGPAFFTLEDPEGNQILVDQHVRGITIQGTSNRLGI